MGIELSEAQRWDLLSDHMVMRLATVDPEGRPHVAPIWYLSDRSRGAVYFSTPEDTRKAANIERTPEVALTVDEGARYFELKAVVLEGQASVVEDPAEREAVEEAWCRKYFDQPTRPDYMGDLYRGRPWVWYRVDPGHWVSWDNSSIDLDRLRGD